MDNLKSIIAVIEKYYPKLEGFDEEVILNNKQLPELTALCEKEKSGYLNWHHQLNNLQSLLPECVIEDDTLFEANEPSFKAFVINKERDFRMSLYISVMVPYYTTFLQSEHSSYANDINLRVIAFLEKILPDFKYLSFKDCKRELSYIKVPDCYGESEIATVADCIFSVRSMKYY